MKTRVLCILSPFSFSSEGSSLLYLWQSVKSSALHIAAGSIRSYNDSQNLNTITKSLHLHNVTTCSMYHQEEGNKREGGEKLQNILPDPATFSEITSIKYYWPTKTGNKHELHLQFSSYHAVNTHYFHCKDQSVNVIPEKSCHLFKSQCKTHKYSMQAEHRILAC